jgi:predicted signal transduction protein with EAL and GGDEF domain
MSESSTGRGIGTKTFAALMAVMIIAFLAGLFIMNNNYASLQSELAATKSQVSSLQSTIYALNQNYTLLQEVRNYLLAQVDELTQRSNQTQVFSRAFSYRIDMKYDNKTLYFDDGLGGETSVATPTAEFVDAQLTPQGGETLVSEPWATPIYPPLWLKEPESQTPVALLLQTNAIRAHFATSAFTWDYTTSWDYVEAFYREHHDYYDITLTGTVQLLYFRGSSNVTFVIIDNASDTMDQFTLGLP